MAKAIKGKGEDKLTPPTGFVLKDIPDANILSRHDFDMLGRAFAVIDGGKEIAGAVIAAIGDLAVLDRVGLAALGGTADVDDVASLFADFTPWPAGMGANRPPFASKVAPVLALRSPGAPLVAAFLAGGEAEAGRVMVGRAITAFLWRAEPVARVVLAARLLAEGRFDPKQFSAVAGFAAEVLAAPRDPKSLVAAFREGLSALPFPWPGDFDPRIPTRPPFSSYLTPENQTWLHCSLGVARLFPPVPDIPESSPAPGLVSPAVLCQNAVTLAGVDVTLTSAGIGFGPQGNWGIAVNGAPVTITSWTTSEIRFHATSLAPGCNHLTWTYSANWAPDNGVAAACSEVLRLPIVNAAAGLQALLGDRTRFWTRPGSITVVGPRIGRFTASDGTGGLMALPCTPVILEWAVDQLPCAGATAPITVRLLRDGVQIAPVLPAPVGTTLPTSGSYSDTRERTATYRLEVTGHDSSGRVCGTTTQELVVTRGPKMIALSAPPGVRDGTPITVTISIPCPAPAGGLVVQLASPTAGGLTFPPSVTIPAGGVSANVTVSAGTKCGKATLTASAADHVPASADICVILAPKIVSFKPPKTIPSCTTTSIPLQADCVGSTLKVEAIASDGTVFPLTITPPAAGCVHAATFAIPVRLPPGTFTIRLTDNGLSASTSGFDVAPNPTISTVNPGEVRFNAQCDPATMRITAQATGADSVVFTYTDLGGGIVTRTVTRPAGAMTCAPWSAEFAQAFDRNGDVRIVPMFGMVAGPARTVAVKIGNPNGAFKSITLRGTSPPPGRPAATVERSDTPCGTGTIAPFVPASPASLSSGGTITLTLLPHTFLTYRVTWPATDEVGETSVTSSAMLGHPDGNAATDDV